jgi:hypothetical protein
MFGTEAISDWEEGSPISWRGEWQGKAYEDKGRILRLEPGRVLEYSHFSPLSGLPDRAENYHTVTIALSGEGGPTRVSLSQDNNATEDARAFPGELGENARGTPEVPRRIGSPFETTSRSGRSSSALRILTAGPASHRRYQGDVVQIASPCQK